MATGYGKADLSTAAGRAAYGRAYGAQQNLAYRGTKGRQNLGVSKAEFLGPQQKGKGLGLPLGGLGGRGNNVQYAEEDYQRQLDLMDKAAEMSAGYSSDNTLGTTDIDYENKMITEKLSPELQAEYDALLARSKMQRERAAALGDDPYEMQQYLYNQNLALKVDEQDALRDDTMAQLQAKGMLGSTGGSGILAGVEESILRSNAMDFNDAMAQSQAMFDMERKRGQEDLSTAVALGTKQVPYITAGTNQGRAIAIENVSGVSGASRNIANQLAMRDYGQRKGLWDMLGSGGTGRSGGGGNLFSGGGLGSYIATAATDALGEEGLKTFEDWRDYMFTALPTFTASFGRYRATAPKIVEQIDKKENSKALYKEIWDDYLKPIFDMIKEDRDNPKALSDYKVMVRELAKKYLRS